MVEALEYGRLKTVEQYKELFRLSRETGVNIIWGSDAHHVSEIEISSSILHMLSEVYDFDFLSTINQNANDILQLLGDRR